MRNYLLSLLGRDEYVDEFYLWAFGENWKALSDSIESLNAWNELHGEDLRLHPDGLPNEDIPKMVSFWKANVVSDL